MKAGLQTRLNRLEKVLALSRPRRFMFAVNASEAKAQLAALSPAERDRVVMVHWADAPTGTDAHRS